MSFGRNRLYCDSCQKKTLHFVGESSQGRQWRECAECGREGYWE